MINYSNFKTKLDPFVTEIIARLQNSGYEACIVGGAVRDFLLDRQPKDYDISTSATPEQVRKVFRDRRCLIIGRRFRLVHLCRGNDIFEISTFRKRPEHDGELPRPVRAKDAPEHMIFHDNEFGSAEDDAHRRDFTVNALFYDPVHDRVIDHTGSGLADIEAGRVHSIGDPALRFEEDPVRILRCLKLVGQYGFAIEPETEKALRDTMPLIVHASVSRLSLELEKILKNAYTDRILAVFREYGFLRYFLPALDAVYDTEQGKYLMRLLARRGERIREGKYRASMSLALALFTLPFAESSNGEQPGGLWKVVPDMEEAFRVELLTLFRPHVITRRANAAAVKNLILQTRFRQMEEIDRYFLWKSYPNARELAAIQNDVMWHIDGFDTACPPFPPGWKQKFPSGRNAARNPERRSAGKSVPPPEAGSGEPA